MEYNIVTNYSINQFIRQQSKYYQVDLGQAITLEDRTGERVYNKNDKFAFVYNYHYKAGLAKQGKIGNIVFYTDHQITDEIIVLFIDREDFVHDFDRAKVLDVGIDSYLGHILRISEEEYQRLGQVESQTQNDGATLLEIAREKMKINRGSLTADEMRAILEDERKKNSPQK